MLFRSGGARPALKYSLELGGRIAYILAMTITLPDDPALQRLDEAQLRIDLACGMFADGRVSRGVRGFLP